MMNIDDLRDEILHALAMKPNYPQSIHDLAYSIFQQTDAEVKAAISNALISHDWYVKQGIVRTKEQGKVYRYNLVFKI